LSDAKLRILGQLLAEAAGALPVDIDLSDVPDLVNVPDMWLPPDGHGSLSFRGRCDCALCRIPAP